MGWRPPCNPHTQLPSSAKTRGGSEASPRLELGRFEGAGRRHETPRPERKNTAVRSSLASRGVRVPAPAAPPRAHGATCRAPVGCCALGGLHGGGAFLSAQQTRWQAAAERAGRHTVGLWTVSGVCVTRPETARPQRRWALRSVTRGGNMPGARPPTRPPLRLPLSKWPLLSPFHRVTASKITTLFLCRQLEFWPEDRVSQATRLSHEDVTLLRRAR